MAGIAAGGGKPSGWSPHVSTNGLLSSIDDGAPGVGAVRGVGVGGTAGVGFAAGAAPEPLALLVSAGAGWLPQAPAIAASTNHDITRRVMAVS